MNENLLFIGQPIARQDSAHVRKKTTGHFNDAIIRYAVYYYIKLEYYAAKSIIFVPMGSLQATLQDRLPVANAFYH